MIRALCLTLLCYVSLFAQGASVGLYNEGNNHYRNGDFLAAERAYMRVVDSGVKDARLFYNLGNVHFKLERIGEAILWYERAYLLDPRDGDIKANLLFANQVKPDRDEREQTNAVVTFVVDTFDYPTLGELSVFFALAWFFIFALAAWRLLSRNAVGSLWFIAVIGCGGFAVVGGSWLGVRSYQDAHAIAAIVLAETATAHSGPDGAQTEVFTMHEGTKVNVVRKEGDWFLVRLRNGLGGWVRSGQVVII